MPNILILKGTKLIASYLNIYKFLKITSWYTIPCCLSKDVGVSADTTQFTESP